MDIMYYSAVNIVYDNWCPFIVSQITMVSQIKCTLGLEVGSRNAATPVDEMSGASST